MNKEKQKEIENNKVFYEEIKRLLEARIENNYILGSGCNVFDVLYLTLSKL